MSYNLYINHRILNNILTKCFNNNDIDCVWILTITIVCNIIKKYYWDIIDNPVYKY